MKKILKYILALVTGVALLSSCADYHYQQANKAYERMGYAKAIKHYEKTLIHKNIPDAQIKLAESYRLQYKTVEAERQYATVVQMPESQPIHKLHYARVLMANNKYPEARYWLNEYLRTEPNDVVAKMLLASCNSVSSFMVDTTLYTLNEVHVRKLENYFSAVEYKDGLVFSADKDVFRSSKKNPWTGESYLDLYFIQADTTGKWMTPELLKGEINGRFHEGPATFTQDGNTVYFTRSNYKNKRKLTTDATHTNNLTIYKATLVGDKWENLEELPFNSDNYSCGHPALSADGKILYFISDMPGGLGGTDIWYVKTNGTGYSKPVNLGPVVNTPGNEMFPYMHSDGTLYFSSDAHNTLGGLDVFMTYNDGKIWHEPQNLNYPLNSSMDDFAYFVSKNDDRTGYVSSNRHSADKVYVYTKHDPTLILKGTVTIRGKGTAVGGAKIELLTNESTVAITAFTDKNGHYSAYMKPETDYRIVVSKVGFLTQSSTVSTMGQKTSRDYIRNFELEEMILQKPIVLENIYYDFDKWYIRPDAALELDKFVQTLNDNPTIRIELSSHADCRGSYQYNLVLSDKRAKSAIEYVASQGIERSRLEYKGYGESKPVNDCRCEPDNVGPGKDCTEEQHQQNRRTEFKIIEIRKHATHTVEPNETLYSIAKKYNVPIDQLRELNKLADNTIIAGTTLIIE